MRRYAVAALAFVLAHAFAVLTGCNATEGDQAESKPTPTVQAKPQAPADAQKSTNPLMDPRSAEMTAESPATYSVKFETSKGDFVVEVHRDWSPKGADRFYNLVRHGYYDGCRFFRVLTGFVAQFGINGDPAINAVWRNQPIRDDSVKVSNKRATLSFAMGGPNTRTTQVFINFGDNKNLDGMGFSPFGTVTTGMEVVDGLHAGYGEGAPRGNGPRQDLIQTEGNKYLERDFAKLDYIKKATIVEK
jgi:peptidyl-prolyl cis-trans isomerase A (cyclophilin A)